ncbi:MAG: amino acid adenylation protein [Myxococcaceae bacterium]|nr:amino acid adenylation protein [Myxococcaceae bacterium]
MYVDRVACTDGPSSSVLEQIRAQVARTPDLIAVRHGDTSLSYRELVERVEVMAGRLSHAGVEAGDLVGLCPLRSLELVVGMLAVLRCGAAYVPIDPETPAPRVAEVVQQAALRRVLLHEELRPLFAHTGVELLSLREPHPPASLLAPTSEAHSPGELAYVIFTSGSTGVPKGVEVRKLSLANHATSMARLYDLGPGDRVLCTASIAFDVAAEQIYPALLAGAEVVVRPDSLFASLASFNRYVHEAGITTLILPTALLHEWTRELGAGRLMLPSKVRTVAAGTEQVAASALTTLLASTERPLRFLHGYGPTEATITCTAYLHDGRSFHAGDVVPIGLPLPNTQAYVLDAELAPVSEGELGELYIGGVALARGYLGRDDLTRERFITHSFAQDTQAPERLYRTGDLVRRNAHGELLFVGRADGQLKVRGHRVEPEEVEAALMQQAGVLEAAVVQSGQGEQAQLVAYLVCDGALDLTTLRGACRARLPSYMVPASFVQLAQLPTTLNQKVDRAALRALVRTPAPAQAREAAEDDSELLVAHAFAEALGVPAIGRDDDFFECGGDSLRALHMLQLLRQGHSAELGLADVFEAPTVRALGSRITHRGTVDRPSVLCLKTGVGTPLFLVCGIQIYQALATASVCPNPIYALLVPGESLNVDDPDAIPALASVQVLAAEYIALMRQHTASGPYALGGLSFGGAVAYQMAQQLRAAGESVALVALFDTVLPRAQKRASIAWLKQQLTQLRAPELQTRLTGLHRVLIDKAQRQLRKLRRGPQPRAGNALETLDQRRNLAYQKRLREFDRSLTPYAGRVVLYRATESDEGSLLHAHGFAAFVPDLTVCDVPGDHLGILREPSVQQLAAHLATQLQRS